ncbi:MAG: hypothetical protein ACREQI_08105 [Candidatus Binataceae bacterium]
MPSRLGLIFGPETTSAARPAGAAREEPLSLAAVILWTHAIAGAAWLGASACFAIAAMALAPGSAEQLRFTARGAPRINQLALAAAIVLALTGIANVFNAVRARHGHVSSQFAIVLAIKVTLFLLMLAALGLALRTGAAARREAERGRTGAAAGAMRTMTGAHLATLAMGAVAMLLGLWLVGS